MAEAAAARSRDNSRHRCFVSFHADDEAEVTQFMDDFGDQFIGTAVGVTEDDDFIDSDDTDYVMDQIRELYLGGTTVTIMLIGACTWSRRFVDWETYASLREYKTYAPSGLVAINLPSLGKTGALPKRVEDNRASGYAHYYTYPETKSELRDHITEAFEARTSKKDLIDNSEPRRKNNSAC
jgi:hypothetical protein